MSEKLQPNASPQRGPLNTRIWNRVLESSDAYHDRKARGDAAPFKANWLRNWLTIVKIQNDTGVDLVAGDVVEFDGYLPSTLTTDTPWLSAAIVDLSRPGWGILLEPAPTLVDAPQTVADVAIEGVCVARVTIESELHRFARREPQSKTLVSADRGAAKILAIGPLNDAGGNDCLVQLVDDTPLKFFGIVREDFTQGYDPAGLVKIDVYGRELAANKWQKIPGFVLEAVDWFLQKDEELKKGTKVSACWYLNCWTVDAMHCSPNDLDELNTTSPSTGSPGEMEQNTGGGDPPPVSSPGFELEE